MFQVSSIVSFKTKLSYMVTIYVKKVGPKCGKIVFIDFKILAVNYTRFKLFEFIRLLILYVYLQPEPSKKGNEFF